MDTSGSTEFARLRLRSGLSLSTLAEALGIPGRTLTRYESGSSVPKAGVLESVRRVADSRTPGANRDSFRFVDLFAGIGGLRRPFDEIGGSCVFTSEWSPYAQATYKANFHDGSSHTIAGDITTIASADIPPHDVLLAGFPCQPFSIAGVSKKNSLGLQHGFRCESQGTLFFEVARIIEHHRPFAFLLENVKNLVNHDKGNTFRVICNTLREDLGYRIHTRVIDAKSYLPQHRERIFIVGFRDENAFDFDALSIPDKNAGPRLHSILHPEDGSEDAESPYTTGALGAVAPRYTLTDHLWQYLQNYAAKHKAAGNGFGFGLSGPNDVARTLSARYYKDGSEILIARPGGNPRRLTPRECARLMGFDVPGGDRFRIPVSDMQAYKQFGNSVAVPVVRAVVGHLAPWIVGKLTPLRARSLFD